MTRAENILLLTCLVRFDELLIEAVNKVGKHQLFDSLADPCSAFVWAVLRDCRRDAGAFPGRAMVEVEAYGRLDTTLGFEPNFQSEVKAILANIYTIPDSAVSIEVGRAYLQTALQEAMTTGWLEQLQRLGNLEEMRKYVTEVGADIAGLAADSGKALSKPLEDPGRFLVPKVRTPFGVRVLDLISGGGLAPGEVMGLLGPTGGGKTVMAVSLVCERARRGQHAHLYTYEEKTEGDVMERICSYMTGMDIVHFRDKSLAGVDPAARARLNEESAKYAKYLSVVDLAQGMRGSGGAEEVIRYIDEQTAKGERPALIVIDWLGSMIQRYLAFNNLNSEQYRHVGHQFIDRLSSHAKQHNYGLVIVHQLRTDACRRRSEVKPNVSEAMEMRAFAYFLDACACLGTLSPDTAVGWLCMDKYRRGACSDIMVRLNGPLQRFDQAVGFVTDHRGRFIPQDSAPPDADADPADPGLIDTYKEAYPSVQ